MRVVVEGGEIVIFLSFWPNEAVRGMVEGGEIVMSCHFWSNEAMRAVVEDVGKSSLCVNFGQMRR